MLFLAVKVFNPFLIDDNFYGFQLFSYYEQCHNKYPHELECYDVCSCSSCYNKLRAMAFFGQGKHVFTTIP